MQNGNHQLQPAGSGSSHALTPIASASLPVEGGRQSYDVALAQGDTISAKFQMDLRAYWRLVVKHRWIIIGAVVSALIAGVIVTMLTKPVYKASTTIQIDRESLKIVERGNLKNEDGDRDAYQTQLELLKSRSLAQRTARKLRLAEPGSLLDRGRGKQTSGEEARAPLSPNDLTEREGVAVGFILGGLTIEPIKSSKLVRLTFASGDPVLSQTIVNAIAENFISSNLDRKMDAGSYARQFLEERLQQLRARLEESDRQLVTYSEKEGIVGVDDKQSLLNANLSTASSKLTALTSERIRREELWRYAQANNVASLVEVSNSKIVGALRELKAQLKIEYQQKLSRFKPDFPDMVQLRARMSEIDKEVEAEIANIKRSIRVSYDTALQEEKAIGAEVERLKGEVLNQQGLLIQYTILKREVDTNRSLYDGLLQRYKEIGVGSDVGSNNIFVIDRAELPRGPSSPVLLFNLGVALVCGLALGVTGMFVREHVDNTMKSPEDIEVRLGLTVLGVIPKIGKDENIRDVLRDQHSGVSEAYRSLRTALQFSTSSGIPNCLLLTSARPSEGKTTSSLAIASGFAQLGNRVLLIDADLRNPNVHKALGIDNSAGLSNYLTGAIQATDQFRATDVANLTVISAGPTPPNPAELLASPQMLTLLTVGREMFDIVIVDGPPIMGLADAPILSSMTAGTLLITAAGETPYAAVEAAVKRVRMARAHVIGAVLNKFDMRTVGYSYGYGYGYGQGDLAYGKQLAKPEVANAPAAKPEAMPSAA